MGESVLAPSVWVIKGRARADAQAAAWPWFLVNVEQMRVTEVAGACAGMALEYVPAGIQAQGGVVSMSDPALIPGCYGDTCDCPG